MKRSMVLVLVILLLSMSIGLQTATAAEQPADPETVYQSGEYRYGIREDGTAIIVKYQGKA